MSRCDSITTLLFLTVRQGPRAEEPDFPGLCPETPQDTDIFSLFPLLEEKIN